MKRHDHHLGYYRPLSTGPLHSKVKSETAAKFDYKIGSFNDLNHYNRTYQCDRPQFLKSFHDSNYWTQMATLKTPKSTTCSCYTEKKIGSDWEYKPERYSPPLVLEKPNFTIDSHAQCYSKYLDKHVSTTTMDYHPMFSGGEPISSIANNDAITYWNWPKYCKDNPEFDHTSACRAKERMKNAATYGERMRSIPKFVPHSGLTTETSSQYQIRPQITFDFDEEAYRPTLIPYTGITPKSEYTMYGSGRRIEEVLKCRPGHLRVVD